MRNLWRYGARAGRVAALGGVRRGRHPARASRPRSSPRTATKSGDAQSGPWARRCPTRRSRRDPRRRRRPQVVTVTWSTGAASMTPRTAETDADGVSTSTWTLGTPPGTQTATASVTDATGSPVTFTATAIRRARPGPHGPGHQRPTRGRQPLQPGRLTVPSATTVTWAVGGRRDGAQRGARRRRDAGPERGAGRRAPRLPATRSTRSAPSAITARRTARPAAPGCRARSPWSPPRPDARAGG